MLRPLSLRGKLGESLKSVQKYATPVEEATTSSLEALQAYSLGVKTRLSKGDIAALPYFQRAAELDPNFAMAYLSLAISYANLGELDRMTENVRKAYDLRDKVSEPERLFIEGFYYSYGTGELDKARGVFDLWRQTYPNMFVPYLNLARYFRRDGRLGERVGVVSPGAAPRTKIRTELRQRQRSTHGSQPGGRGRVGFATGTGSKS